MTPPFSIWEQAQMASKKSTPRKKQVVQSPKTKGPKKKAYMPKKGSGGGKTIAGPGY